MKISARDMQDYLLRWMGGNNNVETGLDIRDSINDALLEIWGQHDWPWFQGQRLIQVTAPYVTGTVTYTAANRRFTLSGGTWPEWADYGTLIISPVNVKVSKRLSDTVIEIEDGSSLLEDISTPRAYKLARNEYPLDDNVRKVAYVTFDTYAKIPLCYVPPLEFNKPTTTVLGTPRYFTIQRDRRTLGGLSLVFWPIPPLAKTVQYTCIRKPKPIRVWSDDPGSISVTAAGTAVTGTNTAFSSDHVGCLLRIGKNTTPVTSEIGGNPPAEELTVESVASATALSTLQKIGTTRGPVKYLLTSMIDIDEDIMSSLFKQQCYYELSKKRQMEGKDPTKIYADLMEALYSAKSKSSTNRGMEYAGSFIRNSGVVWVAAGANG